MPKHNQIIKQLRTKLGDLLFEHKDTMQENTYKLLIEELGRSCKVNENESVWVSLMYAKSEITQFPEDMSPKITFCKRTIQLRISQFEKIKRYLRESFDGGTSFDSICNDENEKQYFRKGLDESELFENDDTDFRIIHINMR